MKKLKDKILNEAYVIDERIIKVDHFINHMLDSKLLFDIGVEFSKKIKGATKIVTIEASGIAFAVATSFALDNIPIVFARKTSSAITSNTVYTSNVHSFTKDITSTILIEKNYLNSEDNVIIIDDFLATGSAALGLIDIVNQAGATLLGTGFVIEKGFQGGRKAIEEKGIAVHSLAIIRSLKNNEIQFR